MLGISCARASIGETFTGAIAAVAGSSVSARATVGHRQPDGVHESAVRIPCERAKEDDMATVPPGVWPFHPSHPRELDALTAETQRLLMRFYDLSPSELQELNSNLDRLADYAENMAAWTEEKANPPTSPSPQTQP